MSPRCHTFVLLLAFLLWSLSLSVSFCPSPTIVKIDSTFLVSIMTKLSPAVQGSIEDNDRSAPSPNAKHRVLFRVRDS